jgi:hypothetical protein
MYAEKDKMTGIEDTIFAEKANAVVALVVSIALPARR